MLLAEFLEQMPKLKAEIGKKGKITRKEYTELCAKYGLGTTITETDTEGNDVLIRVTREPRTLIVDN